MSLGAPFSRGPNQADTRTRRALARLANQTKKNKFLGSPSTGDGPPDFRSIATPDLGTGTADNTTFLRGDLTWSTAVQSVGLALPGQFTISGSPVTGSGTLTAVWAAQAKNAFLAGPAAGVNAAPAFRGFALEDFALAGIPLIAYLALPLGNSDSLSNFTGPVSFNSSFIFPANTLNIQAANVIRVKVWGRYSTTGTPSYQWQLKFGSAVIVDSGLWVAGTALNAAPWTMEAMLFINGTNMSGSGEWRVANSLSGSLGTVGGGFDTMVALPATTVVNPGLANAVSLAMSCNAANTSNVVQINQMTIELMPGVALLGL